MHFWNGMLYIAMAFASLLQEQPGFEWNKKSTLTVDEKVEFPGIVLEPGVYVVRLKETIERRSYVEILNRDETQVLVSVVAVPDHRQRENDSSEFSYHEVKWDGPRPVRSWYFSGDLVGLEFVYPKARAKEIAKDSNNYVMASNSTKDGVIVAVTPNFKEIMIDSGPIQTARQKPQK
jgi:hypothetical protein